MTHTDAISSRTAAEDPATAGSRPLRTCVGCRRSVPDAELERFVLREGRVTADPARRAPGRGAWLHPDPDCRDQALRRGGFARSFRRNVDTSALADGALDAGAREARPGG